MKKSIVILILTLCLLCSCTTGNDGKGKTQVDINLEASMPVVKEPLSTTIVVVPVLGAQDFKAENNWMCQYIDKYSGLNITWQVIDPSARDERIAMLLNSGDMPDAVIGYDFTTNDIVQYGVSDGLFRPVNDLLQYMPAFSKFLEENPVAKKAMTATDEKIYGFPAFPNLWSYKSRFFINSTWLKNVGKENPTTLAELKDVLTAFKEQDANGNGDVTDEIPWTGSWSEQHSERCFVLNAYGYVSNGANIAIDYSGERKQIIYMPYAKHYKDYLIYMNDLWKSGVLDPDMFTQAETEVQAAVLEGVVGFTGMSAPYVYDPDHEEEWISINVLVDNPGDTPVFPGPNTIYTMARFVINSEVDDTTAAALANLADFFYTLEGWGFATFGPEAGSDLDWNENGHYYDPETNSIQYNMPEDMTSSWTHRITNLTIYSNPGFNSEGYDPYRLKYAEVYPDSAIGKLYKDGVVFRHDEIELQKKQSPYYVESVPDLFFSLEDLARINELTIPLDDYVASMEAKFITGEISIEDKFDEFISTLESYGVKEYVNIYNKYYEKYNAN
jgi:putative aldouronate transport system substrate-binding protein